MEDLKKRYPNSFDRLGSLKGAYNIRIDPSVKPATHARRKVPIESKEAIDGELDFLIEEEIITEQVEPTPWVSSVTFPRKPNGEVRVCLDPSNLNKAIIREHHKPMTVEEADDTENGHFRSEQHSKSKDAQFRGRQQKGKEEGHWSET